MTNLYPIYITKLLKLFVKSTEFDLAANLHIVVAIQIDKAEWSCWKLVSEAVKKAEKMIMMFPYEFIMDKNARNCFKQKMLLYTTEVK